MKKIKIKIRNKIKKEENIPFYLPFLFSPFYVASFPGGTIEVGRVEPINGTVIVLGAVFTERVSEGATSEYQISTVRYFKVSTLTWTVR